jgi:hypothetical protein
MRFEDWLLGSICLITSCLLAGCARHPSPGFTLEHVRDPIKELCTDDTFSRTAYINAPFVQFQDSAIRLNGAAASELQLKEWAQRKYSRLPEQARWVQISPTSEPRAARVLASLAEASPRLHLREVGASLKDVPRRKLQTDPTSSAYISRCYNRGFIVATPTRLSSSVQPRAA